MEYTNRKKDWQDAREKRRELAQHRAVDKCFDMLDAVADPAPPEAKFCKECDYRKSTFFFGTRQCINCGNCIENPWRPE